MNERVEIMYFDNNHKNVPSEKATIVIARVLDENGKLVNEVFMKGPAATVENDYDKYELDDEDRELLKEFKNMR